MDEAKFGPFELGFRELYRIAIPGYVSLALATMVFPDLNSLDLITKVIVGFFLGLITYSLRISRKIPPYRCFFNKQTTRLQKAIVDCCDFDTECKFTLRKSKAVYSHFLQRFVEPNLRERIHYFTSFYYMFTDVSFILFFYSVVNLFLWLCNNYIPSDCLEFFSNIDIQFSISYISLIPKVILLVLFAIPCGWGGYHIYKGIIDEQIVLVRQQFKDHCRLILSAINLNKKQESKDKASQTCLREIICKMVVTKTKETLKNLVLDPDTNIQVTDCQIIDAIDWRNGSQTTVFRVAINADNKLLVMGEPGNYKGIYKESIETRLNDFLRKINRNYKAWIDVSGEVKSFYKLLPLDKAIKQGVISRASPVYKAAKALELPYVLLRGRYIVGPSPGLVEVVSECIEANHFETVLDLFAGTGAISKAALIKDVKKATCVDRNTSNEISKILTEYSGRIAVRNNDVFDFVGRMKKKFDLIVADPEYEKALKVATEIAPRIRDRCKIFILCHGFVADQEWNASVRQALEEAGFRVESFQKFGQVISKCTPKK